jgi:hypothetical protein
MKDALDDLNSVIEAAKGDKVAIQDRECLNSLKICSVGESDKTKQVEQEVFLKAA